MGTCTAPLEVANPQRRRYEKVDALVGSGAAYTTDQRASRQAVADVLLQEQEDQDVGQNLDKGRPTVAKPAAGRTSPSSPGSDSPTGGKLHGHGGRAGGRGVDSGTTRPPHSATRHIETTAGILSYRELAPVVFWDEGAQPLLSSVTLEIFSLGIDPVNGRLMPVDELMLSATGHCGLVDLAG